MNKQSNNPKAKVSIDYNKEKETLIIFPEVGSPIYLGANLVKHVMGVPYTKKDGTEVTGAQLQAMNSKRAERQQSKEG